MKKSCAIFLLTIISFLCPIHRPPTCAAEGAPDAYVASADPPARAVRGHAVQSNSNYNLPLAEPLLLLLLGSVLLAAAAGLRMWQRRGRAGGE